MIKRNFLTTILTLLISSPLMAAEWEGLIKNLTQNRAEVETLSKETDSIQREKQAELDQWVTRKTDLDTQVQREKLRELQLAEKIKRVESRVRTQGKSDPQAQKKILSWLDNTQKWVEGSIPFQQDQRLQSLKNLRERTNKGRESMEFILADLWTFMESEVKLSQTNEFTIMDIIVDGKTQKAEVARLGMQSLYAVTPDGKILQAKSTNSNWTWMPVHSSAEETSIQLLVKNLKSKNYSGYYFLPVEKNQQMGASL